MLQQTVYLVIRFTQNYPTTPRQAEGNAIAWLYNAALPSQAKIQLIPHHIVNNPQQDTQHPTLQT